MGRARAQPWTGYLLAVLVTVLALLMHWTLDSVSGTTHYDVFYASVALAAILWGQRPGLLAVTLGSLVTIGLFALESGPADFLGSDQVLHLLIFLGLGGAVSLVAGRLRTQRQHVDEQRELLAVMLASIGDAVIATDLDGRVSFLNDEAERLTGWTNQDAGGLPVTAVFRTDHEQPPLPLMNPANALRSQGTGTGLPAPMVLLAKDGREIPLEVNHATIQGADGKVQGAVLIFRDSSKQKSVQEALREAVELRQIALDIAELGTWTCYPSDSGGLTFTGDARCQSILGVSSGRTAHEQFLASVCPEDRARVDQAAEVATAPASDGRYDAEYRVVHADGSVRWVAAKGQVFFQGVGESRRAVRGIGTVMDITARKEAEQALREAVELRQIALDAAKLGTWEYDPRSRTFAVDPRCRTILAMPSDRFQYENLLNAFRPEDREDVNRTLQIALDPTSDGHWDREHRVVWRDGSVRWVVVKGQTFFENEGGSRRAVRVVGTIEDVTEQKRAAEKLRASEELLQQAIHVSGLGVFDYDYRVNVVEWSPRLREMRGVGPDEPVGVPELLARVHPDDRQKVADAVARAEDPNGNGRYVVENRVLWPDGTVRWLSQQGQVFFEGEGPARQRARVVGAVIDITEQKRAEERLRASEELLQQAVRVSGLGIFDHDLRTNTLHWSPKTREMLGVEAEEPGSIAKFLDCVHPEDCPKIAEAVQRGQDPRGDGLHVFECRALWPDGTVRWLTFWAQTFFEGEGESRRAVRVIGMVMDMTERKEAEEALRASEELFRAFFDSAAVGTSLVEPGGRFLQVNDRFCEITGYSREELLQMTPPDLFHPDDRQRDLEDYARYLQGQLPPNAMEQRHVRKDGTAIWVQVNASLLRDPEGRAQRMA
ncbi:MAG: PAS domain S-box protein, partial [Thermoguttaceae bacterium]